MNKRIFREIKSNIARYLALLVLTILAVGMGVGFIAGTGSALDSYEKYLKDNNLEDGYITMEGRLNNDIRKDIENLNVKVYENNYFDITGSGGSTVRIFDQREKIDVPAVTKGRLPSEKDEIFFDQIYASAQGYSVGDHIKIGGIRYKITGIGAFPDYTISLNSQTQMIADRDDFGVAMVAHSRFEKYSKKKITYNYSFVFKDRSMTEAEKNDKMHDIIGTAACISPIKDYGKLDEAFKRMSNASDIDSYSNTDSNKRISPVAAKMQSNQQMAALFVGVVLIIIAFLYVIFVMQTMNQECSVIGTLLALGVRKREILFSYMLPPLLVTLIGSAAGCILGKSVFYKLPLSSLNGYYSLPEIKVTISSEIILTALLAPLILIAAINLVAILKKLSISPLKLIRKDISRRGRRKQSRFSAFSFDFRFHIRIFTQSIGVYVLLFIGIFLGGWLMMFGVGMSSSFDGYIARQTHDPVSKYQYMLTEKYSVKTPDAEAATVGGFTYRSKELGQIYNINGIGIKDNSRYFSDVKTGGYGELAISSDASKKFGKKKGDYIKLENSATGVSKKYRIIQVVPCNIGFAVFTDQSEMNNILRKYEDFYNYYFSDTKLDIPDDKLSSEVTVDDMKASGKVMKDAMKDMITMFPIIAVTIYLIMMFLLVRMVLSKNETGISMLKIFGFTEKEIKKMYIRTTTFVTAASILITLPLQTAVMKAIWPACIATIPGYLDFTMKPAGYIEIALTGFICYIIANLAGMKAIRRIPMTIVLKNQDS